MDTVPNTLAVTNPGPVAAPPRSRGGIIIALLAFILIVTLGGLGYLAYAGYVEIPGITKPAPTLAEIELSFDGVQSAHVVTKLTLAIEPKDPEVEPIRLTDADVMDSKQEDSAAPAGGALAGAAALLGGFLADAKLTVTTDGDWHAQKDADWQLLFDAALSSGGLSFASKGEMRHTGMKTYTRFKTLPTVLPVGDATSIVGKWIEQPASLQGYATSFSSAPSEVFGDAMLSSDVGGQLRSLYLEALHNGTFLVESAIGIDYQSARGWKMTLKFNPARFAEAYDAARKKAGVQDAGTGIFSDDASASFHDAKTQAVIAAATKRLVVTLMVPRKTRIPAEIAFDWRVAADNAIIVDKQLHVTDTTVYSKVNAAFVVQKPEGTVTFRDVIANATDVENVVSEEQKTLEKQLQTVHDLRTALERYFETNKKYPDNLQALIGVKDGKRQVVLVPNDAYTDAAFGYQASAADGYELRYTIIEVSADGVTFLPGPVVKGINTATKFSLSREYGTDDTDGDGFSDYEELRYGTSPYFADTDGDGYKDKQEIDGGFDPLENAKTKKKTSPYLEAQNEFGLSMH